MNFAEHIEKMMRQTLGVDADEAVDEEEEVGYGFYMERDGSGVQKGSLPAIRLSDSNGSLHIFFLDKLINLCLCKIK